MAEHVDLAIIGSGSGNSIITSAMDGWSIAIIESGTFGGTCLNVGCIPTKMLVRPADLLADAGDASRLGVTMRVEDVDWPAIRDRVFGRIDPISAGGLDYRRRGSDAGNTRQITGRARFVGERRLEITGPDGAVTELTAERIVIATGSHADIPAAIRDSGVPVHTSDTVMRLSALPQRMLIVGAGFIACEMAHVFAAYGVQVTIVARGDLLLRHQELSVAEAFTRAARQRWDVRTETNVTGLEQAGDVITAHLDDGTSLETDLVLVATGRTPSTTDLDCAAGGVELHGDGRVEVDAHGRTSAPGVWALGDCCSPIQLKHVANQQARVVAHNLAVDAGLTDGPLESFALANVPGVVFSHPQVASFGPTTQALDALGTPYAAATQFFGGTAYGWALEDTESFCTVVADPESGRILAAHIIGPEASLLLQPLVQAASLGTPAHEVARGQYWPHPALSEVVENALLQLPAPTRG